MSKSSKDEHKTKKVKQAKSILIEKSSLGEIKLNKTRMSDLRAYHWKLHSELASQRNKIHDELKLALLSKCKNYCENNLQRTVKYKYGLHPLSTIGSLVDIGGRFNVGTNINQESLSFAGLYLAQDKDTALQEHLGQKTTALNIELTPLEIALTSASSETTVSVSVNIEKIFDLTNPENLTPFTTLIKKFKISKELVTLSKKLHIPDPRLITTNALLQESLLEKDWRKSARLYDLPSNSQIFGQLAYNSGIEGILYNSKLTGKKCLVLFPSNFVGTDSYITLDDEPPHQLVPTRIDGMNWQITEMDFYDIVESSSEVIKND